MHSRRDTSRGDRGRATARRRWSALTGDSPADSVVFVAGCLALLYGVLTPLHLLALSGSARTTMVAVASLSTALAALVAVAADRSWVPEDRLPRLLAVLMALPMVNSLTHLGVTGELRQTSVLMLAVVAVGAVQRWRHALPVIGVAVAAWAVLVAVRIPDADADAVLHHASGLAMAVFLGYDVHVVRARTERRLRRAHEELDAFTTVSNCVRDGVDPRPAVLASARRLGRAASIAWVEPDGEDLVAVLSDGVDVEGVRIARTATAATAQSFVTGRRIFVADTRTDALANPALVALTGSASTLCEPVVHDGEVLAVIVVGWSTAVASVDDRCVSVVATLAVEAGAALASTRLRQQLEASALTDAMTGIPNRRGWSSSVEQLVRHSRRFGEPLVLALADLDHFKDYNDEHGHDAGDDLLRDFARTARELLRDTDVIARWGGEEFAVALPGSDLAAAQAVLERVRRAVPQGRTCSFGTAQWDGEETVRACLARADAALYRAKDAGRDRISSGTGSPARPHRRRRGGAERG